MPDIQGFFPAISNMGAYIALTPIGTPATADDVIGQLESVTGLGIKVNNVDSTPVSSTSGMSQVTPTTKVWSDAAVSVFKNNANYKRIFEQFFGNNTSDEGFYCDLTIFLPKFADWTDVHDIVLHGYISGFNWADVTKESVQKFGFNFMPSGEIGQADGFMSITGLAANDTSVVKAGANVVFTVTGTGLLPNLLVKGFIGGVAQAITAGYTTGTSTSQTCTVAYPANGTTGDKIYTVKVSKDGGITYDSHTVSVTVAGT